MSQHVTRALSKPQKPSSLRPRSLSQVPSRDSGAITYESAAGHQQSPETHCWSWTPRFSRDERRSDSRPTPAGLLHSSVIGCPAVTPLLALSFGPVATTPPACVRVVEY